MLQNLYDRYACPYFINWAMQAKPIKKQREKVIPLARGRVLEIGMGSGLNLEYYNKSLVNEVFAVEPDNILLEKAKKRALQSNIDLNIQKLKAESMPFENNTFDTVVSTYTMCSIAKLENALEEVKRVLKKDGSFIFSEHGKSPDKNIHKWQKRLNPIQKRLGGGCHLDINIPEVINNVNLKIYKIDSMYIPGPKFLSYHYWGSAIIK